MCLLHCITMDRQQDKIKTETECKKADAIVLTYSDDLPRTLDRLSTYWLPELRRLEVSLCHLRGIQMTAWYETTIGCIPLRITFKYYLFVLFLQIKVPIVVVGCKLDLHDDRQSDIEQIMAPLMQEYREIETIIECSALKQVQVAFNIALIDTNWHVRQFWSW